MLMPIVLDASRYLNLQFNFIKVKTMKTISKLLGAASLLAMSGVASALTVDHISWDPNYALDFSSINNTIYQNISTSSNPVGQVSGYGIINVINGSSAFADAGFQLTYQYSGFTPVVAGTLPTTPGQQIAYTGGIVEFFVHATTIANPSDATSLTLANTGQNGGDLWLSLKGHGIGANNASLIGQVNDNGFGAIGTLTGNGQLDITGGLAMAILDTNKKIDGSDFTFGTTFTSYNPNNTPPSATDIQNAYGSAVYAGRTTVPEPKSVALLALGLLGFSVMRRSKTA